jgi:hypothetical protein
MLQMAGLGTVPYGLSPEGAAARLNALN